MVFEHNNYRAFLKAVLAERISTNPAYSLRAFARDIEVHPAQLSAIFGAKKGLSQESALRVARRLSLGANEADYFCLLVQYESAPSEEVKDAVMTKLRGLNRNIEMRELSVDLFKIIADWYHFPILEMTELKKFDFAPKSIARRLGITPLEAEAAIERLERLELIEKDEKGRYRKAESNLLVKAKHSNKALQSFHKQMLARAAESFDNQRPEERYVGSQTFAIDVAQVEEARAIIDRFRRELVAHFDRGKNPTEVYHLGVQLFKLTKGANQ